MASNNRYKLGMLVRHRVPFFVTGKILDRGPLTNANRPVEHPMVVSCTPDP